MASRHRIASTVRQPTDQENAQHNVLKVKAASRIPTRSALRDVTTNTLVNNKAKETLKKTVSQNQIEQPRAQQPQRKEVKPEKNHQNSVPKNEALIAKYRNPLANLRPLGSRQPSSSNDKSITCKVISPVIVPKSIKNIDENDGGKLFLVSEYVNDIYKYLRSLESQFTIHPKYLTGQTITPKMRAVLVDWLVDVQQQYHLLTETLHLCVAIVDLFLQKLRIITKEKLQLVGVTAMLIACKYEETYSPDITDFVYITDSTYSKEQILSLEKVIVRKLNYSFGRACSLHFLRRYSKAADITPMHHTFGKYFLDLALLDYNLVHVKPSLIAAVASFISYSIYKCETTPGPEIWTETMSFYSSYTYSDLKPYIPILASLILKAPKSKLQAVRSKFSSSDMHHVSSRLELESDNLKILVGEM